MLREESRISRRTGFSETLRKGGKSGNRVLVVSVLRGEVLSGDALSSGARGGIVVGKRQVPKATERNVIKRRLRHLLQRRLDSLPNDTSVVVRALEGAVGMSSEELGFNLDRLLASAFKKANAKAGAAMSGTGTGGLA